MAIQINFGDGTTSTPGFGAFQERHRHIMYWARNQAYLIARDRPTADRYFRGITQGSRSLSQILRDNTQWIHYDPTRNAMGFTPGQGFSKECAIGRSPFQAGRRAVLATLIHELAHCNGAAGGSSTAAEDALPHCGLGTLRELRTGIDNPNTEYLPGLSG